MVLFLTIKIKMIKILITVIIFLKEHYWRIGKESKGESGN